MILEIDEGYNVSPENHASNSFYIHDYLHQIYCPEKFHEMFGLEQWKAKDGDKVRYLITWRGRPVKRIVGSFETAKRKAEIDPNRKLPPCAFRHAFHYSCIKKMAAC